MFRDIRSLDLNLLRTLDALLNERSVTRAAQKLGLTQPAVSGMLTRLRESFDDPLFVRTQRGIVPTLRATELSAPVKQILSDIEALMQPAVFTPAEAEFTLSIAATDYALQVILVPFLATLRQRAPGIRVAVSPLDDASVQARFEKGDTDLALMTPETTPRDLYARRLFDETYVCALRADHPDAQSESLTAERFCRLDHALVSFSGDAFKGVTDSALAEIGKQRRVVLTVTSFLTLTALLRTTDMIAVIPRRLAESEAGLKMLPMPVAVTGFTKLAVWHARTHRDPGHRWVRSLLFDTFPSQGRR